MLVPGRAQQHPLAALTAGDNVFLLDHQGVSRTLHSVYGHPVTCLDASHVLLAFGVKRSGWMEHDSGNRVGHSSEVLLLLLRWLYFCFFRSSFSNFSSIFTFLPLLDFYLPSFSSPSSYLGVKCSRYTGSNGFRSCVRSLEWIFYVIYTHKYFQSWSLSLIFLFFDI